MIKAFLNDIFQRIVTLDKFEQKKKLKNRLKKYRISDNAKVLDFGCGTGLFANVFLNRNWAYYGYDIDNQLTDYAALLHPQGHFTTSRSMLESYGQFDLILANCCFHHIDDVPAVEELKRISDLLSNQGWFYMIDILKVVNDHSRLHRAFMKLEQGRHLRTLQGYEHLIAPDFVIVESSVERSHVLSLGHPANPFFNDLAVFICRKRRT